MKTTTEREPEAFTHQADALLAVFESLPWGVVVADESGRIVSSNPAAEQILGLSFVEPLSADCIPIEGWYLPDQVTMLNPDQLPLVRATSRRSHRR